MKESDPFFCALEVRHQQASEHSWLAKPLILFYKTRIYNSIDSQTLQEVVFSCRANENVRV